jgi:hypothetical protein
MSAMIPRGYISAGGGLYYDAGDIIYAVSRPFKAYGLRAL